jgi:hypothetical protein
MRPDVGTQEAYDQATPDLMMGGLLKRVSSSQIFTVRDLPENEIRRVSNGRYGDLGDELVVVKSLGE